MEPSTLSKGQSLRGVRGVALIEAYGLWRGRRWAEWFALVTASVYVPLEIYAIARHVTWVKVLALVVNSGVVAYMGYVLYYSGRDKKVAAT